MVGLMRGGATVGVGWSGVRRATCPLVVGLDWERSARSRFGRVLWWLGLPSGPFRESWFSLNGVGVISLGEPVLATMKSPAVPPELAEEKDWKLKRGALRGAVSTTVDLAGSQALVVSLAAGSW